MANKNPGSSSAAAFKDRFINDGKDLLKPLQEKEKDGQMEELDLNLLKKVDPSIFEGLLEFSKTEEFKNIMNDPKLNNGYEGKPEPKLFYNEVPFHLQVPANVPMGRPRPSNPVIPPIIDISDDEEECRGNKAPPLIQKNPVYVPPIDVCEENIPFLTSDRPKAEFKDGPCNSRVFGSQSRHSRQINSNNNGSRPNYDNYNKEHKGTNLKSYRSPGFSVPSTSSQFTHSTLPQHALQPSTHSTLPQLVPQPSTHSTLPQHVPQPSHSSSSNSKRLSHNQSQNSLPVENIYDKGLALSCTVCKFNVPHHEYLIAHYIKEHTKYDPPCGLSTANLNVVKNMKLPEAFDRKKTNIAWLDDFNWISPHQFFEPPEKCKMIDCTFRTNFRKKLINHLQEHRDEVLAEPTTVSSFRCIMCDFTTKDGSEFYEHCTGHTGEYMYGCGRCSLTAKNKTILKMHFKTYHDRQKIEIKSNYKAIPQGFSTYGYVCSACGFVQLRKAGLEYHISQRHQSPGTAEIYKFDMNRPEEPKSIPIPPASVDVLQSNPSDNAQLNNVARPHTAPLISAINSQIHERRRAAPVKVRGDPRTAMSRQDKLTQSISESNGRNSVSEASPQRVGENLNNASSCNDASSNVQIENRDDLRTTINVTEQIELLKGRKEKQIVEQIELPVPEGPSEEQTVDQAIDQLPEEQNENLSNEQFERPEESSVAQIEEFENLNEDLSVEFEAIKVKEEIESMANPESHEIENTESSKNTLPLFQAPTIDDTISRLFANLAPSTSTQTTGILSPASNSIMQSISEHDPDVQRKLTDWEERMKIIICSCSEMLNSSNDFCDHRQTRHAGERRIPCSECQIKFDTIHLFIHHLWTTCAKKSARIYSCKGDVGCRFITSSKDQFVNHTNIKHPDLVWFYCYWCESQFATSVSLTNHIKNNCSRAAFLNDYFHSTIKNKVTSNAMPIVAQSNIQKNQTHPPLNVHYRCSVNDCSHESLEREVFINHFQQTHSELLQEKIKLKCKYCGKYSNSFNELVAHLEEQHKDGANVQERTTYRFILPAPSNTERQRLVTETNINQIIMEKLNLENKEAESEPGVCSFVPAVEWGPEEESRVYKLIPLEAMCKYVSLSFLVTKSSTFSQAKLQQWRLDKINFNQLKPIDPIKYTENIKSLAVRKSLYCEAKLRRLYKCCGRECIFTTDKVAEFCEHLDKKFCSYQCVYCDIKLPEPCNTTKLASHITNFHGSSCYQCPHCIYRSINEHYVLVHIHIEHKDLGEKVKVLKCSKSRPSEPCESDVIPPPLLSMVRPISCGTGDCNFVCWDTVAFLNHHKNEHSEIQHIICYFCSLKLDPNESFAAHLKRHKVFDYHCEYCGEGDAQLNNVIVHLITMHPQWIGKVFVRPELSPTKKSPSKVLKPPPSTATRISEKPPLHPASTALTSEVISERGDRNSLVSNGNAPSSFVLKCCYQLCPYSSKSLSDLKNHLRQCDFGQEGARLYCKSCYGTKFAAEQQFVEHLSSSHVIPQDQQDQQVHFSCGVCDFITTDIHLIKIHFFDAHNLEFKATTPEVKDSSDNQNVRTVVYKPEPVKVLISKSANGDFQSSTPSPSVKKGVGDKICVSNDLVGPVSSKDDEHEGETFSSVRKNLIKHFERVETCENTIPNRMEINETETPISPRRVSGENNSASLWRLSRPPTYLQPRERFRCPFTQCRHTSWLHEAPHGHLEMHILVAHEDPFEIPCRYCDIIFNDMSDFHKHLKLHGPKLYRCWYCSYFNYLENVVKGHSISAHGGLPQQIREIRNESETTCEQPNSFELSGNLACEVCKFRCSSDTSLRKHIIQCLSLEIYTCNVCSEEFCNETVIEEHFQKVHVELTPHFTVSLRPKVEMCLNTLVEAQVAESRRHAHLPSISMPPPVRAQGTSGVIITSIADSSTANVTTNSSSLPILSPETMVAESVTELISSTSLSNDKQKKRGTILSKTPRSSTENVKPTVTSSKTASDDDDSIQFNLHCPMCPRSLKEISKFKVHLRQHHHLEAYKCPSCPNEHFSSKDLAIKHQKAEHPDSNEVLLKDSETEEFIIWVIKLLKVIGAEKTNLPRPIPLVCKRDKCMEKFTNLYLFKSHFIEHLRKSKELSTPLKNASTCRDLNNATATNETSNSSRSSQLAMCPYCDYIAAKFNVVEHVFLHYETMFFACTYCNTESRSKWELRKHVNNKHPTEKLVIFRKPVPPNLVLRKCTANFKRAVIISTQMEPTSSNDKGDYVCSKCAFSTSSINNIRYHCQNEHELAPCILFGKNYSGPIRNTKQKAVASNSESVSTDTDDGDNNKDDSSSEPVPCKACDQVLNNMPDWLLHFSENHSEGSNALKQPKKKKRKLNKSAPESLKDKGKDEENQKLNENFAARKGNNKYSVALQCSYCDFVAVARKNLHAHWNKKHRNRKIAFTSIKNIATYQCSSCLFKTPNVKEGRKHIRDMHCLKFTCLKCAKMFTTEVAASAHCNFKHKGEKHKISRKEIDPHQYQILVDAMMGSTSSDDKHSSSNEAVEDKDEGKDKEASKDNDEGKEDDDDDNVRVVKKMKICDNETNGGRAVRASCSTATLVEQKFEPLRKERSKRRRFENMSLNIPEFSFYRNRSSSVTYYQDRLKVNTNLKGFQNHTIPYTHLCEIFDINVRVSIMDIRHDSRYLRHFV